MSCTQEEAHSIPLHTSIPLVPLRSYTYSMLPPTPPPPHTHTHTHKNNNNKFFRNSHDTTLLQHEYVTDRDIPSWVIPLAVLTDCQKILLTPLCQKVVNQFLRKMPAVFWKDRSVWEWGIKKSGKWFQEMTRCENFHCHLQRSQELRDDLSSSVTMRGSSMLLLLVNLEISSLNTLAI